MIIVWGCGSLFLPVASQAAHLTPTPALHCFLWHSSVCQRGTNTVTRLWVFSLFPFRSNVCGVAAHAVLLKDQCHWGCSVAGRCGFVGNGLTVVANCCGYFYTIFCWRALLTLKPISDYATTVNYFLTLKFDWCAIIMNQIFEWRTLKKAVIKEPSFYC